MKTALLITTLCLFHGAAIANVVIDKSGVDEKDYTYDLHQCTELSNQAQKDKVEGGMVSGAVKGAAVGAAVGAISGGSGSSGAKTGAGVGVAGGFLSKNSSKRAAEKSYQAEKQTILRNCMTNRGYVVLN